LGGGHQAGMPAPCHQIGVVQKVIDAPRWIAAPGHGVNKINHRMPAAQVDPSDVHEFDSNMQILVYLLGIAGTQSR
jgi:hypothetical protein